MEIDMRYSLKYGHKECTFRLPAGVHAQLLAPVPMVPLADMRQHLIRSLARPLRAVSFAERSCPTSVAIAVPDETRPTPLKQLLPPLLQELRRAWPRLEPDNIVILVGGGLHPAPDTAQLRRILPPEAFVCRVLAHDAESAACTYYGNTSRGTPVEINAVYAAAEYKICLGQIDPHQFQGFTGGAKGVVVGLGSRSCITANHALMTETGAEAGHVADNPARRDLDEASEQIGIDLAVNVVLDPAGRAVALHTGRPTDVLAAGWPTAAGIYGLKLDRHFDMAVASCGGHPKDICLYQAQKGLNFASRAVAKGGHIILLAACGEGVGDARYADYVRQFSDPAEQMREFCQKGFRVGPHKAFLFSRTLRDYSVGLVSELDAATLTRCLLTKVSLQEDLDRNLAVLAERLGRQPRVAIIPNANTTYFHGPGDAGTSLATAPKQ